MNRTNLLSLAFSSDILVESLTCPLENSPEAQKELFNELFHLKRFIEEGLLSKSLSQSEVIRDEASQYLESQLSGLLGHVLEGCLFYQNHYASLVSSSPSFSFSLFQSLPPLRKRDLQHHFKDIWHTQAVSEAVHFWMTSGSTGEPTQFLLDDFNVVVRDLSYWLIQFIMGNSDLKGEKGRPLVVRLSSAEGNTVWSKPMPLYEGATVWKLPVFRHPKCEIGPALQFVQEQKPLCLAGDPQAFLTFIEAWPEYYPDLPVYPYPLKALTCGGNQLEADARQRIEAFFQHPVTDCYGLAETSIIASQCSYGTFHLHSPINYVEILDEAGNVLPDGALGEIVVTNLLNWTFPFLRYRTGDLGRIQPAGHCPCGLNLPILEEFQGRKRRMMIKPDGTLLAPQQLVPIFVAFSFYQYQLIQSSPSQFTLRYIAKQSLSATEELQIQQALSEQFQSEIEVTFHSCQESLVEPGVKFQDFVSLCHQSAV
ncbi:MAG: AMP-binding protein [Cyanobacteria bacterium]|nr:AMP-binding protein [Cyanobacteriota bacterium]